MMMEDCKVTMNPEELVKWYLDVSWVGSAIDNGATIVWEEKDCPDELMNLYDGDKPIERVAVTKGINPPSYLYPSNGTNEGGFAPNIRSVLINRGDKGFVYVMYGEES